MTFFELDAVTVRRKAGAVERTILDQLSARTEHAVTLITGPSGAGKTSLLRLLNGLDSPTTGIVRYADQSLARWTPRELRRRVGMVVQQPQPIASTGQAELELAAALADKPAPDRMVTDALDLSAALLQQAPEDLSVGERQRLAIARAIAADPEALILDEPTSAQDEARALAVHELLAEQVRRGRFLVLVEHRLDVLAAHDNATTGHWRLEAGRLTTGEAGGSESAP